MLYSRAHFAVRHAASKDESRYNLNGVHFRADGSTEATDGFMLIRVKAEVPPDDEHPRGCEGKPEAFTLPIDAVDRIVKGLPKRNKIPILDYAVLDVPATNANGSARFVSTDLESDAVTEARKVEAEFPDTGHILKPEREAETPAFAINLDLVVRLAKAVREFTGSTRPTSTVTSANGSAGTSSLPSSSSAASP